ncbi:sugar porter family MFS transporter [Paracoccus denitrificans]|uniref:MFS transporter n=1 Tax=Paracoccus denitrificans TaxID=266 RepID=UPI001E5F146E|nr:MFS transporter [Paracoccus denitrificans]UFS63866.1 sugar porter family MFS transporter [Paracoccus denitrificans]
MAISILPGGPAMRDAFGRLPIDEAPLKPIHIVAAAAVLGGAVLDGYVLGIVGPALSIARQEMQLSAISQGLIASSALIGVFIGGLFFGNLADRFGRRPVFGWNLAAFIVLSVLQIFVQDVWQLAAIRLALGLAIGVEYAVGSSVLAEFSRRKGRGVLLGCFSIGWQVGFTVAFVVGSFYDGDNWRMLLASSVIPALITFVLRMTLPETPMWLKAQGRDAEARAIVDKHFGSEYAIPDVDPNPHHASPRELFTAETWRQTLYSGLFWFCQVGPFFGIFTFLAPVLESLGLRDATAVDMSLNAIQIAGAVVGVFLLHWMSRRGFVIWTFVIVLLTFLALGLFPQAPTWVVVALFATYMFVAPAANNIQFVYPPEIFDTHIRATGIGFSAAFSRISAAGVTYLLPWLLQKFGFSATLVMMAGFPLLGLVLSIFWAPETKGKHLR